jgi:hypothetical protein
MSTLRKRYARTTIPRRSDTGGAEVFAAATFGESFVCEDEASEFDGVACGTERAAFVSEIEDGDAKTIMRDPYALVRSRQPDRELEV